MEPSEASQAAPKAAPRRAAPLPHAHALDIAKSHLQTLLLISMALHCVVFIFELLIDPDAFNIFRVSYGLAVSIVGLIIMSKTSTRMHYLLCLAYFSLAALTVVRIIQVFMWGRHGENNIPFSVINFSGLFSILIIGGYQPVLLIQVGVFFQTIKVIPLIEAFLEESAAIAAAQRKQKVAQKAAAAAKHEHEHEAVEISQNEYAKTLPVIPGLLKKGMTGSSTKSDDDEVVPLDTIDSGHPSESSNQ